MAKPYDSSTNIHSTGSRSCRTMAHRGNERKFDGTMCDKQDIRGLDNGTPVEISPQRNTLRRFIPLASKKDFVEQWLMGHSDIIHNNDIELDNGPQSPVMPPSTRSKRALRSPFRNSNKMKRLKNAHDMSTHSMKYVADMPSPSRSKENRVANVNNSLVERMSKHRSAEHLMDTPSRQSSTNFARLLSDDCLSDFNYQSHNDIIPGSPRKIMKQSVTNGSKHVLELSADSYKACKITPYESPVRRMTSDIERHSPDIVEVESVAPSSSLFDSTDDCIDCESPKKLDIQSLPSSPQVMKVCIDSGSSDITETDNDLIIDTDRDKMISQAIDDEVANLSISINNSECDGNQICAERQIISPVHSCASDETFFSQDYSFDQIVNKQDMHVLPSQTISQDCVSFQNFDVKNDAIDREISSGNSVHLQTSKVENSDLCPVIAPATVKRKRKPKKGSLAGRLQALIVGQTSFLRIWRHQMTQKHSGKSNKFIVLKMINCTSIYSRQILVGEVMNDAHNLLSEIRGGNSSTEDGDEHNCATPKRKTVTLLTVPEIVGTINVKENSTMEVYTPWEVIDEEKMILNISYFRIKSDNSLMSEKVGDERSNEIIEKFSCPCLAAGHLVNSCKTKFTNVKPSLMRYLFDD